MRRGWVVMTLGNTEPVLGGRRQVTAWVSVHKRPEVGECTLMLAVTQGRDSSPPKQRPLLVGRGGRGEELAIEIKSV